MGGGMLKVGRRVEMDVGWDGVDGMDVGWLGLGVGCSWGEWCRLRFFLGWEWGRNKLIQFC